MTLSVIMVTYNSADVVEGALRSVAGLWDELLVGDGGSTDGTVEIVRKYEGKVIRQKRINLGQRKQELVEKAKGQWILILDADERVSEELREEIQKVLKRNIKMDSRLRGNDNNAYRIPYQNYVFGKPVYYGGEKYAKVRLFRKGFARISPEALHEEIIIEKAKDGFRLKGRNDNMIGELKGVIHHHSYRTPWQLVVKFTRYAWTAAGMKMEKEKEKILDSRLRGNDKKSGGDGKETIGNDNMLKKLFLYGPHMFWARFVKEKGYKDGWRGLVLALAFGYMEGLTYWLLFLRAVFS